MGSSLSSLAPVDPGARAAPQGGRGDSTPPWVEGHLAAWVLATHTWPDVPARLAVGALPAPSPPPRPRSAARARPAASPPPPPPVPGPGARSGWRSAGRAPASVRRRGRLPPWLRARRSPPERLVRRRGNAAARGAAQQVAACLTTAGAAAGHRDAGTTSGGRRLPCLGARSQPGRAGSPGLLARRGRTRCAALRSARPRPPRAPPPRRGAPAAAAARQSRGAELAGEGAGGRGRRCGPRSPRARGALPTRVAPAALRRCRRSSRRGGVQLRPRRPEAEAPAVPRTCAASR